MGTALAAFIEIFKATIPAAIGIGGVFVGARLSRRKEDEALKRQSAQDAAYLAALVGVGLDRFIDGCIAVTQDDGQPDAEGFRKSVSATPNFDPSEYPVEWRCLPAQLMYKALDFPYSIGFADEAISNAMTFAAMPPDFEEFFEERQSQYAELGIKAMDIAKELRANASVPEREYHEFFQPRAIFEKTIGCVKQNQKSRYLELPDFEQ